MVNTEDCTKQIIEAVNCPYEVFTSKNDPDEIMVAYLNAKEEGIKEGFTPLLVVVSDTLAETLKFNEDDDYTKDKLLQKNLSDAKKIFDGYAEYYESNLDDEDLLGEMDYGEEINELSSCDINGDAETILFKIPTKNPWEVIAWVPMGGWNECPAPDDMMAISKYWYEKYGAFPALVSSDTVEYVLDKPVSDEDESWELAKEHYLFCSDRVFQGTETETIGEIADCISKSTVWFFWWD